MPEQKAIMRLLIFNPESGSLSAEGRTRLREAFPQHTTYEVAVGDSVESSLKSLPLTADAEVVVAGGDGTVEAAARALAGSQRRLAIVPTGTFNNFARALGLPDDLDACIEVARGGEARHVTVGWVGEVAFLEAAAVGAMGELVRAGEALKEFKYGDLLPALRQLVTARTFRYWLSSKDVRGGVASSLIFANTPTMGAGLKVGDTDPTQAQLSLTVVPATTTGFLGRLVEMLTRGRKRRPLQLTQVEVRTDPPLPVHADTVQVGETPVTVRADPRGLRVILPAP